MLRLIIAISVFLSALNCHAIDLEEAIEKAVKNSAKVKSQFYQYKSAEKQLKSSGVAGFLPEAVLQYRFDESLQPQYNGTSRLMLTQKLIDGGGNFATFNRSQYLLRVEKIKLHQLKQEVALSAIKAYVDVLKKTEILKLREHKERIALEHLSAMQKRFSLSEVTNAEVSLAKAKFSSSISERVDAEGKFKLAKVAYYHLIGEEVDDLSEIDELFLPSVPELDECLSLVKSSNLNLKEAAYRRSAARMEVRAEASRFLPSLSLNVNKYISENDTFDRFFNNVGITFTLDIPILQRGTNVFGVGKAQMDVKRYTYAYREVVKDVEQVVINVWNNLLTARTMIKASQEAEKAATLALEGVEKEVNLNLKSTTDLLEAEDTLFKARSGLAEARSNYVISVYNLLFIINSIKL
ncbi:MAG: TolC family protein [Wolbachia endosymbiont of Tyrophagus putrescentiae]|nr:TolC family protein [Wolbachia endosymbiont of Tyrophagus putrescentiae]